MGNYFDDLVLDEKELYETVIVKIQIPSMQRIDDRSRYFTRLLRKALYDEKESILT